MAIWHGFAEHPASLSHHFKHMLGMHLRVRVSLDAYGSTCESFNMTKVGCSPPQMQDDAGSHAMSPSHLLPSSETHAGIVQKGLSCQSDEAGSHQVVVLQCGPDNEGEWELGEVWGTQENSD